MSQQNRTLDRALLGRPTDAASFAVDVSLREKFGPVVVCAKNGNVTMLDRDLPGVVPGVLVGAMDRRW